MGAPPKKRSNPSRCTREIHGPDDPQQRLMEVPEGGRGTPWTRDEVEAAVAAYMAMLRRELSGIAVRQARGGPRPPTPVPERTTLDRAEVPEHQCRPRRGGARVDRWVQAAPPLPDGPPGRGPGRRSDPGNRIGEAHDRVRASRNHGRFRGASDRGCPRASAGGRRAGETVRRSASRASPIAAMRDFKRASARVGRRGMGARPRARSSSTAPAAPTLPRTSDGWRAKTATVPATTSSSFRRRWHRAPHRGQDHQPRGSDALLHHALGDRGLAAGTRPTTPSTESMASRATRASMCWMARSKSEHGLSRRSSLASPCSLAPQCPSPT